MSAADSKVQTYLSLADVKLCTRRSSKPGKLVPKQGKVRSTSPADFDDSDKPCSPTAVPETNFHANGEGDVEKILMWGFSESEHLASKTEDEESTTTDTRSVHAQSFHSEEMFPSYVPAVQEAASEQQVTKNEPVSALDFEHLSSENARLGRENALLRQWCLEVEQAVKRAATATAKAPVTRQLEPGLSADAHACGKPSALPATAGPMITHAGPVIMPCASQQQFVLFCQLPSFGSPVLAIPAGTMPVIVPGATAQALPEQHVTPQPSPQVQRTTSPHSETVRKQNMRPQNMPFSGAGHEAVHQIESALDFAENSLLTTVMLRNIPNSYDRAMLLKMMDSEGFAGQYDFVYLPVDFKTTATLGYGFVNLTSHEAAASFMRVFRGYTYWLVPSRKVCKVDWSEPHQGLEAHIERYRNSPMMHGVVPDMYKPVLFKDGIQVPFPEPTRKLREPRIRR